MIKTWLADIKNNYIDAVDPDGAIVKAAFRTAIACIFCIVVLQLSGELALSAWGGFAAFAFVQNDIQDSASNRFWFLITVIFIFTALTFIGMLLGNYPWWFWATVPIVTFGCAYVACLGFQYFNAGVWALFLYILAGATPVSVSQAGKIGLIFLLCGAISLSVCFLLFPLSSYQRVKNHYKRILAKILLLFESSIAVGELRFNQFSAQLDKLLELQEKNMALYLKSKNKSTEEILMNLEKKLYQISLLTKSILVWEKRVSCYPHYGDLGLDNCQQLAGTALKSIMSQIKTKRSPDFTVVYTQLESYRENITQLRRQKIDKSNPELSECLDYAAYFYHYLKLLELLEKISQNLAQMEKI